ncbi:imidazolonepropionase-like amidohydrolase [Sphingomonas vulcanisoli]|uniref:Imidazolonepropionase-like amidohydrolase n=1 Tax=Sphingomonas vulcanisoli TaxID=1658060 RepID=A0ABX0TQL0_9SPHN|nr:amidohydrolase family protein [Sphingomonas vulcanisoli]NIJ07813.1 imidazolonepropionase-like amidohydrolase [Sphingomonas vulcanisoli]
MIAIAAVLVAAPLPAATIAFTGGTVALGDGSAPIANGTVVIANGRVVSAGANAAVPAGAQVVDVHGKWVTPGLIGALTSIGIQDVEGVSETNDTRSKNSPFSAAIDVSDAIDMTSQTIGVERSGGVVRAFTAADASNTIFGGQGAFVSLASMAEPVIKARLFQYAELGEDSMRSGGGTRPAAHALLRAALAAAKNPALASDLSKDALITRADAAALLPVVEGRMPLLVHVERASDIRQVLRLKQDYPALKLVLVGVTEGWMVAPAIAAAHVPVIAAALVDLPESFESLAATQSNVGRMIKAGVQVALSTIDVTGGGPQQRNLTQFAGNLVALTKVPGASGLDWGTAFATITSKPAAVMGLPDYGTLKPGAHADVVVWDGDPLELSSAPVAMFIDGVQQPITSRQTRLRDRYAHPGEGALPKAYER